MRLLVRSCQLDSNALAGIAMKLIELVSKGSEFGPALNEVFKISEADFEKSWTDAAYWALKQGAPYEW